MIHPGTNSQPEEVYYELVNPMLFELGMSEITINPQRNVLCFMQNYKLTGCLACQK